MSILFRLDAGYNLFPLNNFCDVKTNVLIIILALRPTGYYGTPLKGQQVNPYGKIYRRLTKTDLLVRTGLSLPSWTYQRFFDNSVPKSQFYFIVPRDDILPVRSLISLVNLWNPSIKIFLCFWLALVHRPIILNLLVLTKLEDAAMSGKMTISIRYRQTPENGTVTKRPWGQVVFTQLLW